MFRPNHPFLYLLAVLVILFVLAQSIFFLVRAYKRGIAVGMDSSKLRKTVFSTVLFTIAPAFSILIGVITLSKFLGIPLPWIRLSVIGAITYELPAATTTAQSLGISLSQTISDASAYSAIAWVMTLGIFPSLFLPPLILKKLQSGLIDLRKKDTAWSDIFQTAIFLGMISAFLGMVFSGIGSSLKSYIPLFVLLFSSLLMGGCGIIIKRGAKWLETYALSISMLGAMVFSVLITLLL